MASWAWRVLIALVLTAGVAPVGCEPAEVGQVGYDDELDPEILADEEGKADEAAACANHPGGSLAGDDLLVPINKEQQRQLRSDWAPSDLAPIVAPNIMPGRDGLARRAAVAAFTEMAAAAAAEASLALVVRSAYRSFATQCYTFNYKVETNGYDHAARFSARPGRSEHQLGTALDITSRGLDYELTQAMGGTPEGVWLARNAYRFGFGLSYPEGMETFTGYGYEPWHWRYVGRDLARQIHESGQVPRRFLWENSESLP